MFDIAIIGAGIAGLTCAQQLRQAGYRVVVLEKSRGVGGRVATRRLPGTRADFGLRYIEVEGRLLPGLIQVLCDRHLLQVWTDRVYEWEDAGDKGYLKPQEPKPRYVAPTGMNAIGKFLAADLEIWFDRRLCRLTATANAWHLELDAPRNTPDLPFDLKAKAIVLAIPAPQALTILEPLADLSPTFLSHLRSIQYDPCFAAIAGYPAHRQAELAQLNLMWKAVQFPDDRVLAWIGWDSSKRVNPPQPVFVLHSSTAFAQENLEVKDLDGIGKGLLDRAAAWLIPWLNAPEFMQVHRWRYAFPRRWWHQDCLAASLSLPLVCCGDWCGNQQVETALRSGLAAASSMDSQLMGL